LSIEIDFSAGTSIGAACAEAVDKAKKLDVCFVFNFNGAHLMATPKTTPEDLVKEYYLETKKQNEER
jgi:hypothetical protein